MSSRLVGMMCGALTGMVLGAVVVAGVCMNLERSLGLAFGKEPLLLIVAGVFSGGVIGGIVGRKYT